MDDDEELTQKGTQMKLTKKKYKKTMEDQKYDDLSFVVTATWLNHILNLSEDKDMNAERFFFIVRFLAKRADRAGLRFRPSPNQIVSAGQFFGVW